MHLPAVPFLVFFHYFVKKKDQELVHHHLEHQNLLGSRHGDGQILPSTALSPGQVTPSHVHTQKMGRNAPKKEKFIMEEIIDVL